HESDHASLRSHRRAEFRREAGRRRAGGHRPQSSGHRGLPRSRTMSATLLAIDKLEFAYGDLQVLWGIDLTVAKGEIVTLVGANGAGKSTTLKNISRIVRWNSGSITFEGEDLSRLEPHQVVERGIVQVPEG